jgi:magnesium transporter
MMRWIKWDGSGDPIRGDSLDMVRPPEGASLLWVDVEGADATDLALLGQRFRFHPLALEDCAHLDQRPKLEAFDDHTFLVLQSLSEPNRTSIGRGLRMDVVELHAFLGERFLVTVHESRLGSVEHLWQRSLGAGSPLTKGVDFLYYLLADALVDEAIPLIERINDEIEALQLSVLEDPKKHAFQQILQLRSLLIQMRRILAPQRDMMVLLARRGDARVSERTAYYFRDVHDHIVRLTDAIEAQREHLSATLEAYLSSVSNRTNEVMKYLTVLSAVFLPLSFVVGFFGQNFSKFPMFGAWTESTALTWLMIATCLGTPVVMLAWFKYKDWL